MVSYLGRAQLLLFFILECLSKGTFSSCSIWAHLSPASPSLSGPGSPNPLLEGQPALFLPDCGAGGDCTCLLWNLYTCFLALLSRPPSLSPE